MFLDFKEKIAKNTCFVVIFIKNISLLLDYEYFIGIINYNLEKVYFNASS